MKNYKRDCRLEGDDLLGSLTILENDGCVASCGFSTDGKRMEIGSLSGGILYVDTSHENEGLGYEAAKLALNLGISLARKEDRWVSHVFGVTSPENTAAVRIMEKLGFQPDLQRSVGGRLVYGKNLPRHYTQDVMSIYGFKVPEI